MQKTIAIIATMDTKAQESYYIRGNLEELGLSSFLVDVGALSGPGVECDASNREIAALAGEDLQALIKKGQRDQVMAAMGRGAAQLMARLYAEGRLAGVIGIGGNQGASMASTAMKALPLGFPKVLVTTVASGDMRPFVGSKDIYTVFSVSDMVGGPNPVSRVVLANAAAAIHGMVERGRGLVLDPTRPIVAISALGNTEKAAARAVTSLRQQGYEVVTFHASGAGGSAMEGLIEAGAIRAVFELTPHELGEEVIGQGIYQPVTPGRLTAAGRRGIPQLITPGGLEYLCFGPYDSIPAKLKRRKIVMHNPLNANLKLTRAEMALVGVEMARRLNASKGPVRVMIPRKGWSVYGSQGGPLFDPAGNRALVTALKKNLKEGLSLQEFDLHINDPEFVDLCLNELIAMMEMGHG